MLTRFHPHSDGSFTIHKRDDVEPTLEWNKVLRSTPQKSESFHHIASIPAIVIEKWIAESGVPFYALPARELDRFIKKKLRDGWDYLKVTDKRL